MPVRSICNVSSMAMYGIYFCWWGCYTTTLQWWVNSYIQKFQSLIVVDVNLDGAMSRSRSGNISEFHPIEFCTYTWSEAYFETDVTSLAKPARGSLVTLLWSRLTLPTSLGRVASDSLVVFSLFWRHKNTSHRDRLWTYLGVACDPTFRFRTAVQYFRCFRGVACDPTCRFCVAGALLTSSDPIQGCLWPYLSVFDGRCSICDPSEESLVTLLMACCPLYADSSVSSPSLTPVPP